MATGRGAKRAAFATDFIAEVEADARSVTKRVPSAKTIVDVGAEEARAIKVNCDGRVLEFAVNDKCAAGTGTFVEAMARALEISVEEMAEMAIQSTQSIPMNAQCAVFGESEVVSLIHQKVTKPDISRAVMDAIAGRIGSLVRTIGLEREVVMVGGMAKNTRFVNSLEKELKEKLIVPEDAEYFGALGAAETAFSTVSEK